jgi:hypothetical protein
LLLEAEVDEEDEDEEDEEEEEEEEEADDVPSGLTGPKSLTPRPLGLSLSSAAYRRRSLESLSPA